MAGGILSRFDTFLFDLDGVLLDSLPYWRYSTVEYIDKIGIDVPDEFRKDIIKYPGSVIFRQVKELYAPDLDLNKAGMAVAERMKYHYSNDISPKPFVREVLTKLKEENKRVCVATATPKRYSYPALEKFGLDKLIERIYDEETAGCSKRYPSFFINLISLLKVNSNSCIFIDDSLTNITGANQAGIFTCGVEEKIQEPFREDIIKTADIFISDFRYLINLL